MNVPNILTVLRIILTFFFIHYLNQPSFNAKCIAFGIFVIASITDWLDGYIARKYQLITSFGKIMDPISDKFLTLAAFFVFAQLSVIAWWMVVVMAIREIGLTLLRFKAMGQGKVLAAEKLGKYKTVFQMVSIIIILLILLLRQWNGCVEGCVTLLQYSNIIIQLLMWVTVALTVVSGLSNFRDNRRAYGF